MAFVMIATGATSRSRVRTLPVRPLIALAGAAALALLASGAALGYWMAEPAVRSPAPAPAVAQAPTPAAAPFTLEQVGAISGRLFRLESEAAQLSKRIGSMAGDAAALAVARSRSRPGPAIVEPAGPSGGPLLAPRAGGAGLEDLDAQMGRLEHQIETLAGVAAQQSLELMLLPSRLPIAGAELTSSFGNRLDPFAHTHAFHAGLDFAARTGTPIASAAGGVVSFAGFKHDFGGVVEIDHGNGLVTRYAHASELLVRAGQVVTPGERIAIVGSTGRSTGPHLHFEVLRAGGQVDPRRYLAGL
jgi:murein DD-endopeptidase MepM/ murein hydrolase activator NlpD